MAGAIIPTFPLTISAMQNMPPVTNGRKKFKNVRIAGLLRKDCCVFFAFRIEKNTIVPKANVNTEAAIRINLGAIAIHEGVKYSPGICFTDDITFKPANAPANAYKPINMTEVPLNDKYRDDFSIIALISFIVSIASLFFIIKSTLNYKVNKKKLKLMCNTPTLTYFKYQVSLLIPHFY